MSVPIRAYLLLLFIPAPLCSTGQDFSPENDAMNGNVREVTAWHYRDIYVAGMPHDELIPKVRLVYDGQGHVARRYEYNTDNFLTSKTLNTCNKDGDITEERNYNGTGKHIYTRLNEYDRNGHMTLSKLYQANGDLYTKTVYDIDAAGNTVREQNFDAEKHLLTYTVWTYNASNQATTEASYDDLGAETSVIAYRYDPAGNLAGETHNDFGLTTRIEYVRDTAGNVLEQRNYNSEERLTLRISSTYDSHNHITRQVCYGPDGQETGTIAFRNVYDNNGNRIKIFMQDKGTDILVAQLEISTF